MVQFYLVNCFVRMENLYNYIIFERFKVYGKSRKCYFFCYRVTTKMIWKFKMAWIAKEFTNTMFCYKINTITMREENKHIHKKEGTKTIFNNHYFINHTSEHESYNQQIGTNAWQIKMLRQNLHYTKLSFSKLLVNTAILWINMFSKRM